MIHTKPPYFAGDDTILSLAELKWLFPEPGIAIRYAQWRGGDKGTVHIFNGRTEYIEKYVDVINRFVTMGYNVTCHDWRGQGLSTRAVEAGTRGHVKAFSDYQNDADAVMSEGMKLQGPHFLFCHSMGGAIALRYQLRNSTKINRVIYSAPMWKIHLSPALDFVARNVIKFQAKYGDMERVAIGTRDEAYETYEPFKTNLLTGDAENYKKLQEFLMSFPEIAVGGPTYQWLKTARMETTALANVASPIVDSLIFVGENERVVERDAILQRANATKHYRLVDIPKARHEIYLETPAIKEKMWTHIHDFLR